jgi:hypothetical protein
VEEFMQDMEEDEMAMDGLKMPKDVEDDDSELDGIDDEEGEMEMDEYGQEEQDEGDLDEVFATANAHNEMDLVDNFKKQLEKEEEKNKGEFVNDEMVKKIEQLEDEMMNPKSW